MQPGKPGEEFQLHGRPSEVERFTRPGVQRDKLLGEGAGREAVEQLPQRDAVLPAGRVVEDMTNADHFPKSSRR